MSKIDKLSLLRGKPYVVNDDIQLRQPSISEITEYGGDAYLALVSTITGTSYDFRFQLFDGGIDYEDVDDFTMFSMLFPTLTKEEASVIFGELDPSSFSIQLDAENNYFFLANPDGVRIDAIIYQLIVDLKLLV